jgi:hypothetical protein
MRLKPEQIEIMAHEIVRRLEESGSAELSDRESAVERVTRVFHEDLLVEDRLNEEVREILRGLTEQMNRQNIQYHEMFKLVKAKLVRERKLIL